MKTFTSRSVCSLALALLLVGGSAQAVTWADLYRPSTPAASTLTLVQNKSFFASHPVLKLGGIGLGTLVVAGLAIEGWRYHKSTEAKSLWAQITADCKAIAARIRGKKSQAEQKTPDVKEKSADSSTSVNKDSASQPVVETTGAASTSTNATATASTPSESKEANVVDAKKDATTKTPVAEDATKVKMQ